MHPNDIITVDGHLFRRAMCDAYARALNNSPETFGTQAAIDAEILMFTREVERNAPIYFLRNRIKSRLGGSAAYKSIPDLLTKD